MDRDPIPEEIKRFILTSIPSVPYLEAMLLLRSSSERVWSSPDAAQRLFVSDKSAAELLAGLHAAGILAQPVPGQYQYRPASDALHMMIGRVADCYSRHLMPVTHLIHSKTDKRAQQFADAFKWRKDK